MSPLDTKEGRGWLRLTIARIQCSVDDVGTQETERLIRLTHESFSHMGYMCDEERLAFDWITDPAKLAELLASDGQRLGVHMWAVKHEYRPICWGVRGDEYGGFWEMPQARTILAALLQLPDGARAAAERVIRGET
jgi:hypothetical protein